MHRLIVIAQCAEEHFSNILKEMPIIFSDKVRLVFIDDSYMDIRYPVDSNIRSTGSVKMNNQDRYCASSQPAFDLSKTYSYGTENNIVEDTITILIII